MLELKKKEETVLIDITVVHLFFGEGRGGARAAAKRGGGRCRAAAGGDVGEKLLTNDLNSTVYFPPLFLDEES